MYTCAFSQNVAQLTVTMTIEFQWFKKKNSDISLNYSTNDNSI